MNSKIASQSYPLSPPPTPPQHPTKPSHSPVNKTLPSIPNLPEPPVPTPQTTELQKLHQEITQIKQDILLLERHQQIERTISSIKILGEPHPNTSNIRKYRSSERLNHEIEEVKAEIQVQEVKREIERIMGELKMLGKDRDWRVVNCRGQIWKFRWSRFLGNMREREAYLCG